MPFVHLIRNVFFVCIMVCLGVITGCAQDEFTEHPEELLDHVLAQWNSQPELRFRGSTEITISGYRYQPSESMFQANNHPWMIMSQEQFHRVKKQVSLHRESNGGEHLLVLHVDVDPIELKNLIVKNMYRQLEQIEQSTLSTLGTSSEQRVKKQRIMEEAKGQLDEMLDTLSCESTYQFDLDPKSLQAKMLWVETTLNYISQGKERTETISGTYHFQTDDLQIEPK